MPRPLPPLPTFLAILHWIIILNFALEIGYCSWIIFVVLSPEGAGPLMGSAADFPHEAMLVRRAYATEVWIAMAGLSVYLGLTEILPRRLGRAGAA